MTTVRNVSTSTIVCPKLEVANSFFSRMKGLLGRKTLSQEEGLLITNCNSIHMFFMRFSIDVIFINKENKVVGLVENIPPNRLSRIFWKATSAIEVAPGAIQRSSTKVGHLLEIV